MTSRLFACVAASLLGLLALPCPLVVAKPTVEQALGLSPIQEDVEYDKPSDEETATCQIEAQRDDDKVGWVVTNQAGLTLRQFLDTNGDNRVDQWSYYRGGIEIYRDIDADFNGKADQYRWLGTAGIRWGIDTDEDSQIDRWEAISPEEVTAEIVAALRQQNAARFRRVLITGEELAGLGLGDEKKAAIEERVAEATRSFSQLASLQQVVSQDTEWIYFGGNRPGVVPAGTEGSTHDVTVYENVVAMIETDEQHGQVYIGTLIQVGSLWRAIDLPGNLTGEETPLAASGLFFQANMSEPLAGVDQTPPGEVLDETTQKLIAAMEELDQRLAEGDDSAELHEERADLLEDLAEASGDEEDREAWLRQMADSVSAAAQAGSYPEGAERLRQWCDRLESDSPDDPLLPYVRYREMTATWGLALQNAQTSAVEGEEPDFAKIQQDWLARLQEFIENYPASDDAAEAMLQLAVAKEFAGEEDEAKEWYNRLADEFPATLLAKKAAGAIRRLNSVGHVLALSGPAIDGSEVSLRDYEGKIVLIHYWATWCEPCKKDMEDLKAILARFGARKFAIIGVNLDSNRENAVEYLRQNRLAWPQLFEEGGLDSRLANELGIITVPTMLLVDSSGKVINRGIDIGQLEGELNRRLR